MADDLQGWSFATLEKYLDSRIGDMDRRHEQRDILRNENNKAALVAIEQSALAAVRAAKEATDKAERAQQLRNEAQNEWRATLSDLSSTMLPRSQHAADMENLKERFDGLDRRMAVSEGSRTGISATLTMALAVIAIIVSLGVAVVGFGGHGAPAPQEIKR